MFQVIWGILFDWLYAAIEWLADAAFMRMALEYNLEELESRAVAVSAALFTMRPADHRWN